MIWTFIKKKIKKEELGLLKPVVYDQIDHFEKNLKLVKKGGKSGIFYPAIKYIENNQHKSKDNCMM